MAISSAAGTATAAGSSRAIRPIAQPNNPSHASSAQSAAGWTRRSSSRLAKAVAAISTPAISTPSARENTVGKSSSWGLLRSERPTNTTRPASACASAALVVEYLIDRQRQHRAWRPVEVEVATIRSAVERDQCAQQPLLRVRERRRSPTAQTRAPPAPGSAMKSLAHHADQLTQGGRPLDRTGVSGQRIRSGHSGLAQQGAPLRIDTECVALQRYDRKARISLIEIAPEGPELRRHLGQGNDADPTAPPTNAGKGPRSCSRLSTGPRAPDPIGRLLPSRNSKSTTRFAAAMAAASAASSAGSRGRSRIRSKTTTEALSSTRRSIRRAKMRRAASRAASRASPALPPSVRSRLTTATSAGALTCPRVKNSQLSPKRSSKSGPQGRAA